MTRADNTRFLTRAAAGRHQATLRKASDAIEHLDSTGQPVNFSAVAAAAGVSRDSLYRDPAIRDLITRMRSAPSRAATRTAERATAESLRALLSTARAEINRLRAENTMLREQAARHLGEQRAATRPSPTAPAPTRQHPEPHVSDMSTTQNPTPPGLHANRLKITAVLRGLSPYGVCLLGGADLGFWRLVLTGGVAV